MPGPILPGVYTQETPSGTRVIAQAETSVTLFIGASAQGPADRVVRIDDRAAYEREFGPLAQAGLLGKAVEHFFDNGGTQARVLRLDDLQQLAAHFEPGQAVDLAGAFNLLCVPGLSDVALITLLQQQCLRRRAFFIVDSPQGADAAATLEFLSLVQGPDAVNSAMYFPWVNGGPPSGFVAGVYARFDTKGGVWKAPAGIGARLTGAHSLAVDLNSAQHDALNQHGLSCVRHLDSYGTVVWGARTVHGTDAVPSEWKYVNVRRTALCIETSLADGLAWVDMKPDSETLRSQVRQSTEAFLHSLFRQGAFAGELVAQCYAVHCESSSRGERPLTLSVGFAPLKPNEFVWIELVLKRSTFA